MSEATIQQAFETARAHHQAGRLSDARQLYQQILAQQPDHAETLHLCGILELQQGRFDPAIELIEQAIRLNPSAAHYHCNIGQAYLGAGRFKEAIDSLNRALSMRPAYPDALNNLGNALRAAGDIDASIEAYRRAIELERGFVEAHTNLAESLREKGHLEEAIAACRTALALRPNSMEAHNHLGNALRDKGALDEALSEYRQALEINPNSPEVHNNIGTARRLQGQLDDAILAYRHALELKSDFASAQNNLAVALRDIGKIDESIAAQQRALEMQPGWPLAEYNLGLLRLLKGDFEKGWAGYEQRLKVQELAPSRRNVAGPMWEGGDLEEMRIFVHAEQGLGDLIQFCRYVPMLADRGARVALQCPIPLLRLFQCVGGVETFVSTGSPSDPYDLQCPLLSLPARFETRLETIPSDVPYLLPDSDLVETWRLRTGTGRLRVGLVWAGRPEHPNDRNRSMPLAALAPLFEVEQVSFFSLQKGSAASQGAEVDFASRLTDFGNQLSDMAETAAVMSNLDLIITVDTAAAHLAGAMGRPVWVLLPFVPDWRWMLGREDSPWYPTMRLFRQPAPGDWAGTVDLVLQSLRERSARSE